MVDLKLKRVTIRNWMRIREADLELPEKGLVLVQGINSASGGALQSVGSGKTSVGEAISRALLGVQGRFATARQCSTDKDGGMYVSVTAELHGKPLQVQYGYKTEELNPDNEALQYRYEGKTIQRGLIAQTRTQLSKLLGVTPLLASWTVFIDGDSIKFNKLSQSDSVDLVMASLRQPAWSDLHEKSKKKAGAFRRLIAGTEAKAKADAQAVTDAEESLISAKKSRELAKTDYEDAVKENEQQMAELLTKIGIKNQKIGQAKIEMEEIEKKLKLMEAERAAANHALEIQLHEIEDKIQAAQEVREPLNEKRSDAQTKVIQAKTAYENYTSAAKNCPTCKRPMGQIDEKHAAALKAKWDAAKALSDAAGQTWAAAEQSVVDLNESYRKVSKKQREISAQSQVEALSDRHEELDKAIDDALEDVHEMELTLAKMQAGPSDSAVKAAEIRVVDATTALNAASAKLAESSDELRGDQDTVKVLDYWVMAFSPFGIPNMILRDAIAPLNKEARRISATMTGGTIDVRYSTVKELASGLEKAKLNIEVDNRLGDKDLGGSSKGEAGLTNFIVAETLSEVGQVSRRVGYQWLDEVSPHQDQKVCHSLYKYLKHKANELGIVIFIVDHNPIAANYADYVLVAQKVGSGDECKTTLAWQA
jgi:DNA repair exonuclease SbcCD ATPase subunit